MNKKQRTAINKKNKATRQPIKRKDTGKDWVGFNTHMKKEHWIKLNEKRNKQETQSSFIINDDGTKTYTYRREESIVAR